jgi:hypothetical protein
MQQARLLCGEQARLASNPDNVPCLIVTTASWKFRIQLIGCWRDTPEIDTVGWSKIRLVAEACFEGKRRTADLRNGGVYFEVDDTRDLLWYAVSQRATTTQLVVNHRGGRGSDG